jgi:hypothetical protein
MSPARLAAALAVAAAVASPPRAGAGERPIQDNSFLVEEAYNQEPGVIQHISTFQRERGGGWGYSFTEEWPVRGQRHQASFTFSALRPEGGSAGVGDLALNYRLQAVGSGDTRVAFTPRLSGVLPTGQASRGRGAGGVGLQANLPVSVARLGPLVSHLNVGATLTPSAWAGPDEDARQVGFHAGQGLVWLAHPRLNVMLEALYTRTDLALDGGTETEETLHLNPGLRGAIDVPGGLQIVPGVSVPIGAGPSRGERAIFLYLSLEHPFRPAGPTEDET